MITHELKTLPQYFDAVVDGRKPFEIRKNDRGFQTGDYVKLIRLHAVGDNYLKDNKSTIRAITYVLQGGQYGLDDSYCILGLSREEVKP